MNAPTLKDLRKFGFVVGGVFGAIGAWVLYRNGGESWGGLVFAVLGAALILFGAALPRALGPVFSIWMRIAHVLGWINTRLILGAIFYTMFLFARTVMFVLRKDPLHRRPDRSLDTYWVEISEPVPPRESYEHTY